METIVNRVAESGIITVDLVDFIPEEGSIDVFDLKPFLFKEMILKEKDYRTALQSHDWESFRNKHVAVLCSADAIIPVWAYMLAATYLQPVAASVFFGTKEALKNQLIEAAIQKMDAEAFTDKRIIIKGCGATPIPDMAYVSITTKLLPAVKSIMYGEPCSTVPVYKKKS